MANATATAKLPDWPALMSGETAAQYLDISPRHFRTLVSGGEITGRRIGAKSVRYLRAELDEFAAKLPRGKGAGPQLHY